jgi:hypothetical protein
VPGAADAAAGWPGLPLIAATIMAAALGVTGQLAIANWSSLSFPKKMELGKMKGQRNSGVAVWTAFGVQIVLGGICALLLLLGQWTGNPWLPVGALALLTLAALGGYRASLRVVGRLANGGEDAISDSDFRSVVRGDVLCGTRRGASQAR